MSKCDKCGGKGYILVDDFISLPIMLKPVICPSCSDNIEEVKQTNADKICSMSDEELAEFLINIKSGTDLTFGEYVHFDYTIFSNTVQIINWLQSEVSE